MLSLTADGQSIVSRRHADRVERLRGLIDRLSPADRGQLLSIAGVLDQIVQLASEQDEQDEKHDERSGK
jgi:nitrogen-specific signal transduction histidine kinase